MSQIRDRESPSALAGVGIALAMVLCCAGPVLVAGGALTAVGGFFGNPLVIAVGLAVVVVAVAVVVRGRAAGAKCGEPDKQ
ncbi:MAG: hypothetical protein ACT4OX_17020 [Actinomycetota bacterium]